MEFQLVKNIKESDTLRNSFINLAMETFDLSFKDWYAQGYWSGSYLPYALCDGNRVVANASVNIIPTLWQGQPKRYIQIGTVMTDTGCRDRGLSRYLLNEIIADWKNSCDAIYLYANDTVLGFYPKFGFQKEVEHTYSTIVTPAFGDFKKLDINRLTDRELLKHCYHMSNPYSQLPMRDNYGLLMFYCADFMKDCIYYSKEYDTACIAQVDGDTLTCFDILGKGGVSMHTILSKLSETGIRQATLGFTPSDTQTCICTPMEGEDTLFVFSKKENLFSEHKVRMPALSHA